MRLSRRDEEEARRIVNSTTLQIDEPVFWLVCRARGLADEVRGKWHHLRGVSAFVATLTGEGVVGEDVGRGAGAEWRREKWVMRQSGIGWAVRWDVLGKCADALGVPMELLVDEGYYVRRTRGWTPYRVLCEAYRKGVADLVDIMPPPARRGFLTLSLAKAYKAFFQGKFFGRGDALCRSVSENGFFYYGSLHFSHILWTLEALGMPVWMLSAPYRRVAGVAGATEADAAISTLWRALTHEDRVAMAGIMKALAERRGLEERMAAVREVLEAVEAKKAERKSVGAEDEAVCG